MCMITYLPANVPVPVAGIVNGGTSNDDGHGWAVAAETGLMITGHSMELETSLEGFIAARDSFPNAPALFHSRWATHGTKDVKNVHPFYVGNRDTVVAHNGILPATFHPAKGDRRSDTRIMADEWLYSQTKGGLWTRSERRRIGSLIGTNNKLCILSVSPKFDRPKGFLVNPNSGVWQYGAWFSNHDFEGWGRAIGGRRVFTGWYDWDDETPVKSAADSAATFAPAKVCEWCFGYATINAANICRECLTCQDCYEHADNCQCYVPRALMAAESRENGTESDDDPTSDVLTHEDRLGAALALASDPEWIARTRPFHD